MTIRTQLRVAATTVPGLVDELNTILERLQNGALPLWGLKLDFQRTAVPTDAPAPGTPNVVGVTVGGVQKVYMYDATTWVQL